MQSTLANDSMIISIHIPKTAGTTFAHFLRRSFPDGVLGDYGAETPDVNELFESCSKNITNIKEDGEFQIRLISEGILKCKSLLVERGIQVIHGHFDLNKYSGFFRKPLMSCGYASHWNAPCRTITFTNEPWRIQATRQIDLFTKGNYPLKSGCTCRMLSIFSFDWYGRFEEISFCGSCRRSSKS